MWILWLVSLLAAFLAGMKLVKPVSGWLKLYPVLRWLGRWIAPTFLLTACLNAQAVDTTGWTHDSTLIAWRYTDSVAVWRQDSSPVLDTLVGPPPPPVGGTHEPAGFTRLTNRTCDAVVEDGWSTPSSANLRIVRDPVRGNVCQTTFPVGYRSGAAPVTVDRIIAAPWPSRLYIRYWALTSSNWQSHPILTKQFHFWINAKAGNGGGNRGFTMLTGTSSAGFYTQGTISAVGKMSPQAGAPRGMWHLHEILLDGGPAGHVTYWLDGKQFLSQPVIWGLASSPNKWERISWSPTYGGLGNPVPFTMTESWDDLYVSGTP